MPDTGIPTRDAFERRRHVTQRYVGPLRNTYWDDNYEALMKDGWTVRVFLGDKEIPDWQSADPDKGDVCVPMGTLRGNVEIRITRPPNCTQVQ